MGEVAPVAEACDNLDNNCNGQVDEGNPGGGISCATGQSGACAAGMTACSGGAVVCNAINQPQAEACDNLDNNCNGLVDEGNPQGGLVCNTGQSGICALGTTACTGGSVVCNATTQPAPETCDALDNNCNGQVDDGNPGGGAACNTGKPGVCGPGTTNCSGGAITCNSITPPTSETCDLLDNDCDGLVDEGNPGGGAACSTGQIGVCAAGIMKCLGGAITCSPVNQPQAELCDNLDNDCDGLVDEDNPGGGSACNTGQLGACGVGSAQCVGGTPICNVVNQPTPEICDNIDNDCDGQVDEGNPGGGLDCGPSIGGCKQKLACINGAVVCSGTFVGPAGVGSPGNPGSQAQPLATIAAAQAKAVAFGGGADVCVCDTAAAGESVYQEHVTMIEGISVIGGYNCADWSRNITTYVTTIKGPTPPYGVIVASPVVDFPAGITSITALDGLTVRGSDVQFVMSASTYSTAIRIHNSSPSLLDVKAIGGTSAYSTGLSVSANNGTAAPIVTGGSYRGWGSSAGTGWLSHSLAVDLNGTGGTFTNVEMGPNGGSVTNSMGLRVSNSSATIVGGSINAGYSNHNSTGVSASGNLVGLSITNTSINGGFSGATSGESVGVRFNSCIGSPTLTGVSINGGNSSNSTTGLSATGMACTPTIVGGSVSGGTTWSYGSIAVQCRDNAVCNVSNATITGGTGTSDATGVYCDTGGTGTFSGNTIMAKPGASSALYERAVRVNGSDPTFDGNMIAAPNCSGVSGSGKTVHAAYFTNSTSLLTNNVFYDQPCNGAIVEILRIENASPTLHNNTIQFVTCSGCGVKHGLFLAGTTAISARNNLFLNAGTGEFANGFAVYEKDATSDLMFIENNDFWVPNGGTMYFNEGTTSLSLADINALSGAANNISVDPQLDATFHLLPSSPCRNAGTATGGPVFDFDGDPRPQEMIYDIGADEYVP